MTSRRGDRGRGEGGQAAVELALVLPVLVLLLLGLVQVGSVLSSYLTLQIAASEGARVAITGAQDSAIVKRVDNVAADINPNDLTVTVSPSPPRKSGSDVTVAVTYQDPIIFGELASLWGTAIPMTAAVTMKME